MLNSLKEKQAKSILTPSNLPTDDYVVNPYSGCLFGCVYCYADFMRRFTGHVDEKWGEYVDVKINTIEIFEKEIENLVKSIKAGRRDLTKYKNGIRPCIVFSSVTDPYQGIESKYKLTRRCLEIILNSGLDCDVNILTKSPLVRRDIDIFTKLKHVSVGLTITTTDDEFARIFEVDAPPASKRLEVLKMLNDNGIETYAFVGPLFPHFSEDLDALGCLFDEIKNTGTKSVWVEHINLSGPKFSRLYNLVKDKVSADLLLKFKESQKPEYKEKINVYVKKVLKEKGLELVTGELEEHGKK